MNGNQTSKRLRHTIILALGLGISHVAFSLSLGPINVKSYLGQPMNATIRVDGLTANAASGKKVSLASPAAFRSRGIEMLPIHSQMRFSLVPSGKGYYIKVTSTGGVKEPFVNFLVTLSGGGSTVTREYAAFFNPNPANTTAGRSAEPTAVIEKSRPQKEHKVIAERSEPPRTRTHAANTSGWGGKPTARKAKSEPKVAAESVRPSTPRQAASGSPNTPSSIPVGSTYGPIKPGETLYSIAKAARPNENMRIYDMMRLIYKANRRAFAGNDMGNLMAGATLHIPDPANRNSAAKVEKGKKSTIKAEPKAQKPAVKPEPKKSPLPVEAVESVKPEKLPTSPAAQLAFGIGNEPKKEKMPEVVTELPKPQPIPKEDKALKVDAPETIDSKPAIPVPPPVIELPKPELNPIIQIEEPKPEPQPEPQPIPRPQPRVTTPPPAPVQPVAEDDSFFGFGKFFKELGLPLPLLGGAFAGLLALIGGLFWFLKKRKEKNKDEIEEFTEEELNQMVAQMEEEHGDLNFDQLATLQESGDRFDQPTAITKLDPISEPYEGDSTSLDDMSDDFFKDLEASTAAPDLDAPFEDKTIADASELTDDFFDDLEFEDHDSKPIADHASSLSAEDDDFLSTFDDAALQDIDITPEPSEEHAKTEEFDDFLTGGDIGPEDDFFADNDTPPPARHKSTATIEDSDDGLDFFDDIDMGESENSISAVEMEKEEATDALDDLEFFTNDSAPDGQFASKDTHEADNTLDFFADEPDKSSFSGLDAQVDAQDDFFADDFEDKSVADNVVDFFDDSSDSVDFDTAESKESIKEEIAIPPAPTLAPSSQPVAPTLAKPAAPEVDEEAMEINLDMAKSFISMGKGEKARSWLDEILELGTAEQKAKAREMLAKIDKG